MSELRVGTSGWQYKHWKGRFYPKERPTAKWLEHYTRSFDTVELNNPFYRQPEKKTFESGAGPSRTISSTRSSSIDSLRGYAKRENARSEVTVRDLANEKETGAIRSLSLPIREQRLPLPRPYQVTQPGVRTGDQIEHHIRAESRRSADHASPLGRSRVGKEDLE